jgi:tRNA A37 threonylcarbamoyladenosine biosynthesis protein TsaE
LANIYEGRFRVAHLDLYRLGEKGPALSEFMEAGLDEYLDGLALIEWPGRLPDDYWPEDRLMLILSEAPPTARGGEPTRIARFAGPVPKGLFALLGGFPRPRG